MQEALGHRLQDLPQSLSTSITYDNGTEKGSLENVIGLIRRTYPKKTDWNLISQSDLDTIPFRLNHLPKKWIDFLSPDEALSVALAA